MEMFKRGGMRLFVLTAGMLAAVSCANNVPAQSSADPSSAPAESSSAYSSEASAATSSATSIVTSVDVTTRYTVTFNALNGQDPTTKQVKENDTLKSAPTPERSGYSFLGWCTAYDKATKMGKEGTEISLPMPIVANTVLYARWIKAQAGSHTPEEIAAYMEGLASSSEPGHLYFHYYRFGNDAADYGNWDIWAWPYRPKEDAGTRFDWVGRTTSADKLDATGTAIIDDFGGAVADLDLTQPEYEGGTTNQGHKIGGTFFNFYQKDGVTIDTEIGVQIVRSETRRKTEGKFWTNDGGDLHVDLTDPERVYTVDLGNGQKAWHVFALQDKTADFQSTVINDLSDPFEDDDGTNVTRGNDAYDSYKGKWGQYAAVQATAPDFLNNVGVGYQIQVATFSDSDGDGFGDIYGITQKLEYLSKLGVRALWLTPVQMSDSYHGYDISDYQKVDPKFGSSQSPAALANNGKVTEATAMADYEELIQKAKAKGMRIVMDLVLNHTSTSNKWFIKSAQLDPSYRAFYQWGNHVKEPGAVNEDKCWLPYGEHDYSYYAKFGSSMPELNYQYSATRQAVFDVSNFWADKGVAGFRLDAVKHVFMTDEVVSANNDTIVVDKVYKDGKLTADYSSNLSKNLHFYQELNAAVKKNHPNVFFVGENFDGNAYHVSPWYRAFDSMFDFYGYFNLTTAAAKVYNSSIGGNTFNNFITGGGTFTLDSSVQDKGGIYSGVAGQYKWDLSSVLQSYNKYRNGKAMPGFFTSNHDIARVINRIAGTQYDNNGLTEQGTITAQNYAKFRKAADLVKATEILMPGLTWIYYGDEIGMVGNFPSGKDSKSDYADLYWRQPMKWAATTTPGQQNMTGFSFTGSPVGIELEALNQSSTVVPANTQMNNPDSEFSKLAKLIKFKHDNAGEMIGGTLSDNGSSATQWKYKVGNVYVTVDFNSGNVTASSSGGNVSVTF